MTDIVELTDEQVKNLNTLATYLESLPEDYNLFNMALFATEKVYEDYCEEHGYDPSDLPEEVYTEIENWEEKIHANMKLYVENKADFHTCGSAACAVGHGPAAGIPFPKAEIAEMGSVEELDWNAYSCNFIDIKEERDAWDWCFDGMWSNVDNHHWGAAARIRYLLDKREVPESYFDGDWSDCPAEYAEYLEEIKNKPKFDTSKIENIIGLDILDEFRNV